MNVGGELRWNPLLERWVAVAPGRAARPMEGSGVPGSATAGRSRGEDGSAAMGVGDAEPVTLDLAPGCPFCPGHESELPGILWESPAPHPPGWWTRSVPNRFPAFTEPPPETLPPAREARGRQEVLIESPEHHADLSTMAPGALEKVVEGYRERYAALESDPAIARVLLFRNRGPASGNSLRHPHAQLVGLAFDPPAARRRDDALLRLGGELGGHCPLCDPARFEPDFETLVIDRDDHFVAWVPWAAEVPGEVWITARRHSPGFAECTPEELEGLARVLGDVARRLRDAAGDPDYNLLLYASARGASQRNDLHWWMRFRPRTTTAGGMELLGDVTVNPASPEEDARRLRGSDPAGRERKSERNTRTRGA